MTLGFGEIIPQFVRNADNLGGFNLTAGTFGINPIDSPGFGQALNDSLGLPVSFQQSFDKINLFYWSALVLLLFTIFCSIRLRDSRLGRAWIAIREDETAAAAMGVPLMRTKTAAYALGAFFGGVAGAFYASFKGGAFPSEFFFNISVFLLCMVILGGMGSVWGVVVAGAILTYLNQEGLSNIGSWLNNETPLDFEVAKYQFGIYGFIIVLMMLFRPQGLIPESRRKREIDGRPTSHGDPLRREARVMADLLVAQQVRKEFGGLVAVNDVDFVIPQGSIVSLIGPNGAGKTTFFNMLTGVYKPTDGIIVFDDHDVTGQPPHNDHEARRGPDLPEHPPLRAT